jgi:hypothetical protein
VVQIGAPTTTITANASASAGAAALANLKAVYLTPKSDTLHLENRYARRPIVLEARCCVYQPLVFGEGAARKERLSTTPAIQFRNSVSSSGTGVLRALLQIYPSPWKPSWPVSGSVGAFIWAQSRRNPQCSVASESGPSFGGPWFGCILRGFCRFAQNPLRHFADSLDLGGGPGVGQPPPAPPSSLQRPRGMPM